MKKDRNQNGGNKDLSWKRGRGVGNIDPFCYGARGGPNTGALVGPKRRIKDEKYVA